MARWRDRLSEAERIQKLGPFRERQTNYYEPMLRAPH